MGIKPAVKLPKLSEREQLCAKLEDRAAHMEKFFGSEDWAYISGMIQERADQAYADHNIPGRKGAEYVESIQTYDLLTKLLKDLRETPMREAMEARAELQQEKSQFPMMESFDQAE